MRLLSTKYGLIFLLLIFGSFPGFAQKLTLSGEWHFALDPLSRGEQNDWHLPGDVKETNGSFTWSGWDVVKVPHCWSVDNRYNHFGKAWYKKGFKIPGSLNSKTARLQFEAVFYRCRIFINGTFAGAHEGGYTPFEIDATKYLRFPETNVISVEVDNSWNDYLVPGSRAGSNPNDQLYPWYEYGGITRDVALVITGKVFVEKQKIESVPNLSNGTAAIKTISWITNNSFADTTITILYAITNRATGKEITPSKNTPLTQSIKIAPYTTQAIELNISLPARDVVLWDFDNPNLYDIKTTFQKSGIAPEETFQAYFGIRKIEVKGVQMLINGKTFRVAGANRHADHPVYGSSDPKEIAELDMRIMRNGNMIMARLNHTPPNRSFIQWADENGFLIIGEIPNWQISPVYLKNEQVRANYASQVKELVERDWNSPSIFAWSTGNEYQSWTPEGDAWTAYQMGVYKKLDNTRLLTFIGHGKAAAELNVPHDSFRYCDFLNINIYSPKEQFAQMADELHQKYPDKPIFISEFGQRADQVENEEVRSQYLRDVISILRERPFIVGCSYWSFNITKAGLWARILLADRVSGALWIHKESQGEFMLPFSQNFHPPL